MRHQCPHGDRLVPPGWREVPRDLAIVGVRINRDGRVHWLKYRQQSSAAEASATRSAAAARSAAERARQGVAWHRAECLALVAVRVGIDGWKLDLLQQMNDLAVE